METIISDQDAGYEPAVFVTMRTALSIVGPDTLGVGDAEMLTISLPLCRPDHIIADPGTLRLGDALISAIFPPPRRPDHIVADPGTLRLGDASAQLRLRARY